MPWRWRWRWPVSGCKTVSSPLSTRGALCLEKPDSPNRYKIKANLSALGSRFWGTWPMGTRPVALAASFMNFWSEDKVPSIQQTSLAFSLCPRGLGVVMCVIYLQIPVMPQCSPPVVTGPPGTSSHARGLCLLGQDHDIRFQPVRILTTLSSTAGFQRKPVTLTYRRLCHPTKP